MNGFSLFFPLSVKTPSVLENGKYLHDQHSEVVTTREFFFYPVTSPQCRGTDAVIESSCPSIGWISKEAEPRHRLVGRKGLDIGVAGGVVG